MISISKLCCGTISPGDVIRYGEPVSGAEGRGMTAPPSARERKPVVVWNITRRCNLKCRHCYSDSEDKPYEGELTTEEAKGVIDDLSQFKVPVILFSGGEPLMRKDIFELISYAVEKGIRTVLSTNGTLISYKVAQRLRQLGTSYVGISLDGIGEINDQFRGETGAFNRVVQGFQACHDAGVKAGLRMTLTRHNFGQLGQIFAFIKEERIPRACFYHLVYTGRGRSLQPQDLSHEETRQAVDIIINHTFELYHQGIEKDILTVDNHVDGVYLYLKLLTDKPKRAAEVLKLLRWNGGGLYSSGVGIGAIDPEGNVHPDQFWTHYNLGNVRERKFSEIWSNEKEPMLTGLRDRVRRIKGRCAKCHWFSACGGSLRVRAEYVYGDPWAPEPACYLTDQEIGLTKDDISLLESKNQLYPGFEAT